MIWISLFLWVGVCMPQVQVWRSENNLRSILSSSSTVGSEHQTYLIGLVGQVPLSAKLSHLSKSLWPVLQWQMTSIKLFLVIWSLLSLETYAFICYSVTSQPLCWAHDAHDTWIGEPPRTGLQSLVHVSSTGYLVGPSTAWKVSSHACSGLPHFGCRSATTISNVPS